MLTAISIEEGGRFYGKNHSSSGEHDLRCVRGAHQRISARSVPNKEDHRGGEENMKFLKQFDRDYWMYWMASAVSMAASNILQYILSLYVLEISGSAILFASMLSITILPRLFLTPLAGVMADRIRKITLMSWIVLGEAAVLGVYALLESQFHMGIIWIYALVVILEIGEVFYDGASAAILPELVPLDQVKDAISVSKVDDGVVVVASPMAAALIFSTIPIHWAFAIVALLNFLAFIMQRCIRTKYETERGTNIKKPSVWQDFWQGVSYIRQDSFLRGFIVVLPMANLFFSATFSVSVMVLLRERFNLSAYAYGLYCSITSSMSIIVPLMAVPIVKKYNIRRIYAVCTSLIAAEIGAIALAAYLGVNGHIPVMASVAAITILDCMTIAEAMPMQMSASAMVQTSVKKELLGRVTSTIKMISIASIALGDMLFGLLNDMTMVWFPILIGAIGIGAASIAYRKIAQT